MAFHNVFEGVFTCHEYYQLGRTMYIIISYQWPLSPLPPLTILQSYFVLYKSSKSKNANYTKIPQILVQKCIRELIDSIIK